MAGQDYKESQGVKTQRDNEFKTKLVDGQSGGVATKVLSVVQDGDTYSDGVNDFAIPVATHSSDGKMRLMKSDSAGNIMAVIGNPAGSAIVSDLKHHNGSGSGVASGTPDNHDKTITTGKTVSGLKVTVASTGLFRWDVGLWDGVSFTPYVQIYTCPSSPMAVVTNSLMPVGDGTKAIRVIANNLESTNDDGYSTSEWVEN